MAEKNNPLENKLLQVTREKELLTKQLFEKDKRIHALEAELIEKVANSPYDSYFVAETFVVNDLNNKLATPRKLILEGKAEHILEKICVSNQNGDLKFFPVSKDVDCTQLVAGQTVMIDSQGNVEGINGLYRGGEYYQFNRILEDGRWEVSDDQGTLVKAISPVPGFKGQCEPVPGDRLRVAGNWAFENIQQALKQRELIEKIEKRNREDLVGTGLQEIIDFFCNLIRAYYKKVQVGPQPFLMLGLAGLPGLGKTMTMKFLASFIASLFQIEDMVVAKASQIYNSYINGSQNAVNTLFYLVKKMALDSGISLMMLDEFDQFVNISGSDCESSWKKSAMVPTWKRELQPDELQNVIILTTLNEKVNLGEAISERMRMRTVSFEVDAVPHLIRNLFESSNIYETFDQADDLIVRLMEHLQYDEMGEIHYRDRHNQPLSPSMYMTYRDIKNTTLNWIDEGLYTDQPLSPEHFMIRMYQSSWEKASRMRHGIENGHAYSNLREFLSIPDKDLGNIHEINIHPRSEEKCQVNEMAELM